LLWIARAKKGQCGDKLGLWGRVRCFCPVPFY
jgi:hypothetical protein